uniref:Extracellular solute-binding protein family 3 n=1 Tax=Cyanothece sp. (strain PCC 7425 / ATCC 29141) TaxID=395961 RepID=B8HUN7_CYAP4
MAAQRKSALLNVSPLNVSPLNVSLSNALLSGLLPLLLLSPLSALNSAQAQTPNSQPPRTTLVMGTATDYPPFQYRIGSEGEIVGFDIELANYIAKKLGLTYQIQDIDFNQLIPALAGRKLDFALAAITPTPERRQIVDFSLVYFQSRDTIISRSDREIKQFRDLAGRSVGVQLGTIQERQIEELTQQMPNLKIVRFRRVGEMVQALRIGQVDAAIVEAIVAETYTENRPELKMYPITEKPATEFAIAFPKGSVLVKDFNRILQEMISSGEMELMIRRWFSPQ